MFANADPNSCFSTMPEKKGEEKEGGALHPTNDVKTRKLLLIKMLAKRQLMTEKKNL